MSRPLIYPVRFLYAGRCRMVTYRLSCLMLYEQRELWELLDNVLENNQRKSEEKMFFR